MGYSRKVSEICLFVYFVLVYFYGIIYCVVKDLHKVGNKRRWMKFWKLKLKFIRVVAVDMRGYGETDKPNAVSDYSLEKLVEDIRHLIPALGTVLCLP